MLLTILGYLTTIHFHNEPQLAIAPLLIAALAGSAIKAGTGLYQSIKGNSMATPQSQSALEVPKSYQERLDRLKTREGSVSTVMPGQGLMENKLGAATASGITAMKEAGNQASFGNTIAQFVQQEQDKLADIGISAAQRKDRLQSEAFDATSQAMKDKESYEMAIQQAKENRKFEIEGSKLAEKTSLQGAGMQNLTGSLDTLASTAMTFGGDGVGAKKTSPTDYSSMTQEQMSAVYAASKIPGYLIGK